MSVVRTFFRHCPSCGRRFEIRLVGKELVKEERVRTTLTAAEANARDEFIVGGAPPVSTPLVVGVDEPVTVDVDSFQYTYKCKHCGHQWSEVRQEEHMEP